VDLVKRQLDEFAVAAAAGRGRRPPLLIAEKALPSPMINVISRVYPRSRRVFLVRDFRDTYCSARAMNAKRGTPSFGRSSFSDDVAWLASFGRGLGQVMQYYRLNQGTSTLLRYEDLVTDTEAELARVFREVGIDHDPRTVKDVIARASGGFEISIHQTASDTASSVGRWRTELTTDERDAVEAQFTDLLVGLGYAPH
jgi:hypothetical protein